MGSHAQDKNTQQAATAGAQDQDKVLAQNAQKNQQFADQTRSSLFGTYNPSSGYSGGTLSNYLNPVNDNGQLSGTYQNQYNNASNDIAQGANSAVGTTMQTLANRGMGKTPSGFAADQVRKAYQDASTARGNLYTGLASQQHGENLSNFWNANNMLNSNASQTANLSLAGNQAAAGNYANLYGTASQQKQNPWAVAGQTIAGLGQAAGGAMTGYGNL